MVNNFNEHEYQKRTTLRVGKSLSISGATFEGMLLPYHAAEL